MAGVSFLTDSLVAISTAQGIILLQPGVRDAAKRENMAQVQVRKSVKVPYWFDGVVKGW